MQEIAVTRVTIAPRIVVDSDIRFGKPVIEGTRVPVHLLVGQLAGGMDFGAFCLWPPEYTAM